MTAPRGSGRGVSYMRGTSRTRSGVAGCSVACAGERDAERPAMILGHDEGAAVSMSGAGSPGDDRLREECGVFGVFGNPEAAAITALGLHALQHRGQEAAGIVTYERAVPLRAPPGPRRRQLHQGRRDRAPERPHRHRPQALLDHRRRHPAQRAAAVRRPRYRRLRRRPQRQPHQRPDAAPGSHLLRRHLPVDLRHRGHPAPPLALAAPPHRRALHRGHAPDRRRLRPRLPHQRHADRRPRSDRHPPAGARQARLGLRAGLGDMCPRHRRRRVRARDRERRGRHHHRRRHREPPALPDAPGAALHLRVHLFLAARLHHRRAHRL